MEEIWKDIPGCDGYYQASSLGRIKGKRVAILKPCIVLGYHNVSVSIKGKCVSRRVHRLVAITFLPNPENKPEINHINGVKDDNRVENLGNEDDNDLMILCHKCHEKAHKK